MVTLNPMNIYQKYCVLCIIYRTLFIIGEQIWFVNIKLLIIIKYIKKWLEKNQNINLSIVFKFIKTSNLFYIYFIIFSYFMNSQFKLKMFLYNNLFLFQHFLSLLNYKCELENEVRSRSESEFTEILETTDTVFDDSIRLYNLGIDNLLNCLTENIMTKVKYISKQYKRDR